MIYGYDAQIIVVILILLAAAGSATWNSLVKAHQQPLTLVTLMTLPQIIIALPFALMNFPQNPHTLNIIFLSSIIQTAYIVFLAKAYSRANLSIVYPIAIGLAPFFSFSFSHLIYNKTPNFSELIGIIIICMAAMGFSIFNRDFWNKTSLSAKLYTLIVAILTAGYGLIDSFGVKQEHGVVSYISWLFLVKGLMLTVPMILLKKIKLTDVHQDWKSYLISGLLAGIGYSVAIWSFYYAITPLVLSLRAISIVFVVLIARTIIKEKVSFYKIILSIVMVLGIALIVIY